MAKTEEDRPPVTTMRAAKNRQRTREKANDEQQEEQAPARSRTRVRRREEVDEPTQPANATDDGDEDEDPEDEPKEPVKARFRKPGESKKSAEAEEDDDDDDDVVIRGGWSEGQTVMDSTSNFAQALKLDTGIVYVMFLDDQPYANFRRHWVERRGASGQKSTRAYVCLETVGKQCPLCDIGDRAQAVSAFNVALIGDDGQVSLKSWDVGARLFQVLQNYNRDRKTGPLTRNVFQANKTGKRNNVQYNVSPILKHRFEEDTEIELPTEAMLKKIGKYDASILQIPKKKELDEIAAELSDDEYDEDDDD